MNTNQIVTDLIKGNKLSEPIELDLTQALLLAIAQDVHVIRSSVGILAFFAIVGAIFGFLIAIL